MIQDLPTDKIHRRDDARQINLANVEALASSIADIGLINPIRVRPNSDGWEVSAGGHRLEACRSLGLVEITCDVIEEAEAEAESAMIDENMVRQELSPVDRARYLARRKELYLQKHPDGRTRNSQQLRNDRFTAHVAKVTGQSESTVQQAIKRASDVVPEVMDMVRGTPLDQGNYLDTLARLSPNDQFAAAQRDLARERENSRVKSAATNAADLAAKARKKAAKGVAQMILTHVPEDEIDALLSLLKSVGKASDIASEIGALR